MASVVITNSGQEIVLLNPAEKAEKFAKQLRNGKDARKRKLTKS